MPSGPEQAVLQQFHRLYGPGSLAGLSEGQLLDRFAASGDEAAFEALVRSHGPMVRGVCRRMLRDPNDADDAFQATFLVLVRRAGSIRDGEQLSPWLHGVALRVASRVRSRIARSRDRERPGAEEATVAAADPSSWEVRQLLDEELGRLPEKYRSPIVLCYLEGRSHEEAARRLRWPLGTVKGRLARARDLLRSRLARRGVVASAATLIAALPREVSAALPEALWESTARAASRFWAARATTGAVSSSTILLAEGVLKTMLWTQTKMVAAAALLSLSVVAAGAGVWAQSGGKAGAAREGGSSLVAEKVAAERPAQEDADRIQGNWSLVAVTEGGEAAPLPDEEFRSMIVTHDAWISMVGAGGSVRLEATPYQLNPAVEPKTIDLTPGSGPYKGKTFLGIYRFDDDDTLLIGTSVPGQPRPADFTPPKGAVRVSTYRRSKKDAPADKAPAASPPAVTTPAARPPAPPDVPEPGPRLDSRLRDFSPPRRREDDAQSPDTREPSHHELAIQLRRAEAVFHHKQELSRSGAVPRSELDQARADLDLCKARIEARLEGLLEDLGILESQLQAKRGRLKKAEAAWAVAIAELRRVENIRRNRGANFVSGPEIAKAEGETGVADAQRDIERAEIAEHDLRIKRAKRLIAEFEKLAPANDP